MALPQPPDNSQTSAPGFADYPEHTVTITPSTAHIRILVDERVIADTVRSLLVSESRHDPVYYLPASDVDGSLLTPSDTTTHCPFKGDASYYSITAGNGQLEDSVWSYQNPFKECTALAGYLAFYPNRVTLEIEQAN